MKITKLNFLYGINVIPSSKSKLDWLSNENKDFGLLEGLDNIYTRMRSIAEKESGGHKMAVWHFSMSADGYGGDNFRAEMRGNGFEIDVVFEPINPDTDLPPWEG